MSTVPTDSVLRRHHEQMQEAARLVPTDSVLRRHYEQMLQAGTSRAARAGSEDAAAPAQSASGVVEPRSAPAREPVTARPAPEPAASQSQGGGFFGWLKRLFGG